MNDLGRFTARGGIDAERTLTAIISRVRKTVQRVVEPSRLQALVLLGGYGRGEGGVLRGGGRERPHNNLDLLLIVKRCDRASVRCLKRGTDRALEAVSADCGIGIDLGVITGRALRSATPTLMWHDMRYGHKTLLGDAHLVPSLSRFELPEVSVLEFLNLLVNRGSLLLINEILLERGTEILYPHVLVKHVMKAVIGYGDALLRSQDRYDWSYVVRQRAMRSADTIDPALRDLYEEAVEFRFEPRYDCYPASEMRGWIDSILPVLEKAHLDFERWRLAREDLTWDSYPEAFFSSCVRTPSDLRGVHRTLRNLSSSTPCPLPAAPRARLGFRLGGARGALTAFFPLIAYGGANARTRSLVASALRAEGNSGLELIRAYLGRWGIYGDPNFGVVLEKLDLDLGGDLPKTGGSEQ